MNFGIIGFGAIADIHAQVIKTIEGARLVAIAARSEEKACEAAQPGCNGCRCSRKALYR